MKAFGEWFDDPVARVCNVRGYDGLPNQFVVESQYGWLSGCGWDKDLSKVRTFRTVIEAKAYTRSIFPDVEWRRENAIVHLPPDVREKGWRS